MEQKPKNEVSWRAAEYEHIHRTPTWFLWVGGIALLLLLFAIWQKNFFFAMFVVIASILLMSLSRREPDTIDFKVSERGVGVAKHFYEYDEFEHFAIRNRPGALDEIILRRKMLMNPFLRIPADSRTAEKAREILKEKLQEVDHEDSLIEVVAELLGF